MLEQNPFEPAPQNSGDNGEPTGSSPLLNEPEPSVSQPAQPASPASQPASPVPPVNQPKYGAMADANTQWVYGEQVYQGGSPQEHVAEQRRLEAERRAREAQAAEKATQAARNNPDQPARNQGFFANPAMHSQGSNNNPNFNQQRDPFAAPQTFGTADMSGINGLGNNGWSPIRKLPGMAAPVIILIVGLLLFFIISPAVFVTGSISTIFGSSQVVESTDGNISVNSSRGRYVVVSAQLKNSGEQLKCEATQDGKKLDDMLVDTPQSGLSQTAIYSSATDGKVDIKCVDSKGDVPTEIVAIGGIGFSSIALIFGISTVLGITGIVLTIWGIVWIVRRRRERRMIMMGY